MKRIILILLFVVILMISTAIDDDTDKNDCTNPENACYWNGVVEGKAGWRKNP